MYPSHWHPGDRLASTKKHTQHIHAHTIIQVTYYVVTFPVEYKVNIHYYSMDVVNLQKEEPEPRREEKRREEKRRGREGEEKRREEKRGEEKRS